MGRTKIDKDDEKRNEWLDADTADCFTAKQLLEIAEILSHLKQAHDGGDDFWLRFPAIDIAVADSSEYVVGHLRQDPNCEWIFRPIGPEQREHSEDDTETKG